ncbi:hypothetical protein F0562_015870 [Nyssa sinensis]|uniref:Uncharacterized protein n=1 Tax=Nyssa sinensis TaxID=561372 RepID=A0A5J4ZLU8_9ASTE|nr:hypothetical protein F0562_015870 [Nyssa sinensis]
MTLQISPGHARLVVDTLASVLHSYSGQLVFAKTTELDFVGADVYHLILFLPIQSHKRLRPRTHKDSTTVADVWPSTSALDGILSALSPLQLVRCNSLQFMPSQADERGSSVILFTEAVGQHSLSFVGLCGRARISGGLQALLGEKKGLDSARGGLLGERKGLDSVKGKQFL